MKPLKLKLGTHMDSWLMYSVYLNQGRHITGGVPPLDRSYNVPLTKNFCCTFLKKCKGNKVEI